MKLMRAPSCQHGHCTATRLITAAERELMVAPSTSPPQAHCAMQLHSHTQAASTTSCHNSCATVGPDQLPVSCMPCLLCAFSRRPGASACVGVSRCGRRHRPFSVCPCLSAPASAHTNTSSTGPHQQHAGLTSMPQPSCTACLHAMLRSVTLCRQRNRQEQVWPG